MFDLILSCNFQRKHHFTLNKCREIFNSFAPYKKISPRTIEFENHNIVIYGLTRELDQADFLFNDSSIFLIVGEIFLSKKGQEQTGLATGKIDAKRVHFLHENYPENYFDLIKGNFSLIIIQKKDQSANMINSRFGISPIYYSVFKGSLIVSTHLKAFPGLDSYFDQVDEIALLEREIFNYPLAEKTLLKNVTALQSAEMIKFKENRITNHDYWRHQDYYQKELLDKETALEIGSDLFKQSVDIRTQDKEKICASLTGGFDGRTILSVMNKSREDVLLYSFGINGSMNISIPRQISRDNDYKYKSLVLDSSYEAVYSEFAKEVVLQSDCLRPVESANYPYAFQKLAFFSDVVITGIFGSELLRTFQNVGFMVTNNFVKLNRAENSYAAWNYIKQTLINNSYLNSDLIEKNLDIVKEHFSQQIWKQLQDFSENERFYLFLLYEGLRKYFGGEVHSERIYADNRFPYLDDDFVSFVFKSPYAGVYSNALNPSISQRFRSQYFYAYIMRKYRPELLSYPTDHGHSPSDVLSPLALFQIAPKYFLMQWKRRRGYREYKTEEWTEDLYQNSLFEQPQQDGIFSNKMKEDFISDAWKFNRTEFTKAASLKFWLESVGIL